METVEVVKRIIHCCVFSMCVVTKQRKYWVKKWRDLQLGRKYGISLVSYKVNVYIICIA